MSIFVFEFSRVSRVLMFKLLQRFEWWFLFGHMTVGVCFVTAHYVLENGSLPDTIASGDWIEFQKTGAYSCALRTAFNGFDRAFVAEVADAPLLMNPTYNLNAARVA
jgi:hypothetical protein